ncbi:MAG: amidohydrolase family protein [Bifidobacteriaceae bacterium]|jgi:predicted amidohydrolase YtcJ|nr:amidohydrolase family protein [Bifidobacteriaceae bacterium]
MKKVELVVRAEAIHTMAPVSGGAGGSVGGGVGGGADGAGGGTPVRALAAAGGKVVALSQDGDFAGWDTSGAKVVTAPPGGAVLPGLGDVHAHLHMAGHSDLYELFLDPDWSVEQLLEAVAGAAAAAPPGAWIAGGMWGISRFRELASVCVRRRFDAAAGGHPLLLRDDTAHHRLVNDATLRIMGIDLADARSLAPDVDTDPATGEPTGVVGEAASRRAEETWEASRAAVPGEDEASMARAVELLNQTGVTLVQEAATGAQMLRALRCLDDAGRLNAWVVTSVSINDKVFGFVPIGQPLVEQAAGFAGGRVFPTFAKIFLDGTPPTFTALMHDPYPPHPGHGAGYRGEATMSLEQLAGWMAVLAEHGLGVKVHCTGDGAVSLALDALELARSRGVALPAHIAHAQMIQRADYPRIAGLGAVIDICPLFWFPSAFQSGALATLPDATREGICMFRDQLDAGIKLAGGSDWPVSPNPNPWWGIHGLVTRTNPTGEVPGAYRPDQALTVREALSLYTTNVADAAGLGSRAGSLEVGKAADFIVVDRDPFKIDPLLLGATRTLETWVGARQVFAA